MSRHPNLETVQAFAKDLAQEPPRSPRETLGGFVIAARVLDKCRAALNGTLGEYKSPGAMDKRLFAFTEISYEQFRDFVATGASDDAVGAWLQQNARPQERLEIVKWNNTLRYLRISEMSDESQLNIENLYMPMLQAKGRVAHHWFDVYDIEEGRL